MTEQTQTTRETAELGGIRNSPFARCVARVNIPDPRHPGMRIVGYRIEPQGNALGEPLFALAARDADVERLRSGATRVSRGGAAPAGEVLVSLAANLHAVLGAMICAARVVGQLFLNRAAEVVAEAAGQVADANHGVGKLHRAWARSRSSRSQSSMIRQSWVKPPFRRLPRHSMAKS